MTVTVLEAGARRRPPAVFACPSSPEGVQADAGVIVSRELRAPASANSLPQVIAFLEEACGAAGLPADMQFEVVLAAEEACTNVIEHAYDRKGGPLVVAFASNPHSVEITVTDFGVPFDIASYRPPDVTLPLERRKIGGLGVHLIRKLMDEVRFERGPDSNRLVMVKRFAPPSVAADG
jgi:serine/threonine-protein kinase RsbW